MSPLWCSVDLAENSARGYHCVGIHLCTSYRPNDAEQLRRLHLKGRRQLEEVQHAKFVVLNLDLG